MSLIFASLVDTWSYSGEK